MNPDNFSKEYNFHKEIYRQIIDGDDAINNAKIGQEYIETKIKYKKKTTERRAEFESKELEKVNYIKSVMFIIYTITVMGLAYTLYYSTGTSKRTKGFILAFFIVYPLLFIPVILFFYDTLVYMLAVMTGNIYKKTEF